MSYLAVYGPLSVMLLLALWGGLIIVAFALIYHGLGPRFEAAAGLVGFGTLLYMSGSTFLTLGLGDVTSSDPVGRLFILLEAGSAGVMLVGGTDDQLREKSRPQKASHCPFSLR